MDGDVSMNGAAFLQHDGCRVDIAFDGRRCLNFDAAADRKRSMQLAADNDSTSSMFPMTVPPAPMMIVSALWWLPSTRPSTRIVPSV